ncbi:uncharacterized protein LOC132173326 isoform X1 [Corylus avellana]|uniref:uncharacterized protein LOC132173326 isoform X1 n=1 Tax=Corylus avellana TaxID=13451 RepID=UPI00286AF205|nr:uncharacterized protein LOC132173326 isoform X1 [Corylus avellana]XP_059440773.1 uncharacterized protein LOC132173326 isoform X1 [Corylus avellana]XP_059440774.1 uncharacterized protein LOC132173326 isoform X1 [Corylus avellana]
METPDDNHCHSTGIESSFAFQHENQKHLSPNSQPESDVVQCSSDAVARGLSSTLATVIRDFDSRAQDTIGSQDQLSSALDRLTRELDQLLEDAPLPFIMQHAAKILGVRKRVSSLNSILKSIQHRVDNIDRMLSVGMLHGYMDHAEKMGIESSGHH